MKTLCLLLITLLLTGCGLLKMQPAPNGEKVAHHVVPQTVRKDAPLPVTQATPAIPQNIMALVVALQAEADHYRALYYQLLFSTLGVDPVTP
jgi:hypothetical protein